MTPHTVALLGAATKASPHGSSGGTSTPAIILAVLAALIALACLLWALARLTAFEPRWARAARHALAEGGFRVSATWAEFSDWVKLGR